MDRLMDGLHKTASEIFGMPYKYAGNTFYFKKEPFHSPERPYLKRYVMTQEIGSGGHKHLDPPVIALARDVDHAASMVFYWNSVVGPPNVRNVTLRESEKLLPGKVFIKGSWTGRGKPIAVSGVLWEWREREDRVVPNKAGVYITDSADPTLVGSVLLGFTESSRREQYDNSRRFSDLDSRIQSHLRKKIVDPLKSRTP